MLSEKQGTHIIIIKEKIGIRKISYTESKLSLKFYIWRRFRIHHYESLCALASGRAGYLDKPSGID